jgi:hypothetical protein
MWLPAEPDNVTGLEEAPGFIRSVSNELSSAVAV